ncbi:MAG: beta-CASP ribonuclease aCPSF1 [Thermoprotei archaeon]|nr:MAG: beta-CASP ribonuclease aCPSF1 [Thermoprotei archaeon]
MDRVRAKIREEIFKRIPSEAQITKIEFEGPEIAIYVKNVRFIIENEEIIKSLAKVLRKRIVVRVDESSRLSTREALRKILSVLPSDVTLDEDDITFDSVLGEVIIKTSEPRKFYQDDKLLYRMVFQLTGWRPRIVRKPPLKSKILEAALRYMIAQADERIDVLRNIGERIHRDVIFRDQYVRITALGGFQEVGRSAVLVETAESKVLLDFGFNPSAPSAKQTMPRLDVLGIKPEEIDAVVVTHAHLDHCGLIPFLFKYGYEGPIYTTQATRDLMVLLQLDLLDISKREGRPLPFDVKDVHKALLHTVPLRYGEVTDITPDIRLTLYDAGHILGSAMAHLHIGNGLHNIVYTGDFKFGRTRLLNKANTEFPRVDTLIMESTYGGTVQPSREEAERGFINLIKKTIERKGKVLIPALAVGRAQEVMVIIAYAFESGELQEVPVYIEGMINEVTAIHTAYPELLSKELREKIYAGENPFMHEAFNILEGKTARAEIVEDSEPSIIIATSGMLTGGPAVEYFRLMASDPRNMLIFVNYQVEGTLGRKVKDGLKEVHIVAGDRLEVVRVNMEVHAVEGFSGHSDHRQLLAFLANISPKPRRVILNHGEPQAVHALASSIRRSLIGRALSNDTELYIPRILDSLALVT